MLLSFRTIQQVDTITKRPTFFSIVNRIDYEATVKAANDAQASAQIAQNNAAEAAAKASLSNIHDISSHTSHSSHSHGHLDAYGSQKTLTVASPNAAAPANQKNSPSSAEQNSSKDSTARSSNVKPSASASGSSKEVIASNHNYGNSNEFKPSKPFTFAGY